MSREQRFKAVSRAEVSFQWKNPDFPFRNPDFLSGILISHSGILIFYQES